MTIAPGTKIEKSPQPSRPFVLALSDFRGGQGKKRLLDFQTREAVDRWFALLVKVATTDLATLLEPLLEAKEKRNDATQLEDALAARPARVDVALANGASGSKFVLRLDGGRLTVFRALRSGAADVRDVVGTVNLPF